MKFRRITLILVLLAAALTAIGIPSKADATLLYAANANHYSGSPSLILVDTSGVGDFATVIGPMGEYVTDLGALPGGLYGIAEPGPYSLHMMDTTTGAAGADIGAGLPLFSAGLAGGSGTTLFAVRNDTDTLIAIDSTMGAYADIGSGLGIGGVTVFGMAMSRDESVIYGFDAASSSLISIDPLTGLATVIGGGGTLPTYAYGLAMDELGDLYAVITFSDASTTSGDLIKINPADGTWTIIGNDWELYGATGLAPVAAIAAAVPEPATVLLLGAGLTGVGISRRRLRGKPLQDALLIQGDSHRRIF